MADATLGHASVAAWAKVNLTLRILAREDTGYHQLETVFQRISLSDDVTVRLLPGEGIALQCTPAVDVPDPDNLAWRAAVAYRAASGWPRAAIHITLTKRIPTGGGLGGGSADAGAVLRALNALNPAPLAPVALWTVAAALGADVPFLSSEAPRALAWGRGERMLALAPLPVRAVHCAAFTAGVNTAAAYRALAADRAAGRIAAAGSALLRPDGDLGGWAVVTAAAHNDFEGPVYALRPDIQAVHAAWTYADPAALVRMSGSGATVFAVSEQPTDRFASALATVADERSVRHIHATTLETVPPVRILSPANGSG